VVTVPSNFLVHTSGSGQKTSGAKRSGSKSSAKDGGMQTVRSLQTTDDRYPFVIAGRYTSSNVRDAHQKIILWSRSSADGGSGEDNLRKSSAELARTVDVYNEKFGAPPSRVKTFWIVECPVADTCHARFRPLPGTSGDEAEKKTTSAELASSDTVMVDPSGGAPKVAADAAPSLAASWLGYGRNPGFYEQTPPLSQLPIFAADQAREAMEGPASRSEIIRSELQLVPETPPTPAAAPVQTTADTPHGFAILRSMTLASAAPPEEQRVVRAKSVLFFYALQDRYGPQVFHNAITHMLYARAARGFDLDDLIAAFEQETHQNVAQFVRLWMKHPGVPEEFRRRYERGGAAAGGWSPPGDSSLRFQGEQP